MKYLSFNDLEIDENHCRSAGASALAEVLGRNQGPTELTYCGTDFSVVADGLRGDSRLECLTNRDVDEELLAIAGTLKENKGLVVFDLRYCWL
jgi:hypothetical protein